MKTRIVIEFFKERTFAVRVKVVTPVASKAHPVSQPGDSGEGGVANAVAALEGFWKRWLRPALPKWLLPDALKLDAPRGPQGGILPAGGGGIQPRPLHRRPAPEPLETA